MHRVEIKALKMFASKEFQVFTREGDQFSWFMALGTDDEGSAHRHAQYLAAEHKKHTRVVQIKANAPEPICRIICAFLPGGTIDKEE